MNAKEFEAWLKASGEESYKEFTSRLGGTDLKFYGIRIPVLKARLAGLKNDSCFNPYELALNQTVEENMAFLIVNLMRLKTFKEQMGFLAANLKYALSWILTDTIPQYMKKSSIDDFLPYYKVFIKSQEPFKRRFAYVLGMKYSRDEKAVGFLPLIIADDDYYVSMGQAWLVSTIAVFHFDQVFCFLSSLPEGFLKRKSISKICDSFRFTTEQKKLVKALRKGKDE